MSRSARWSLVALGLLLGLVGLLQPDRSRELSRSTFGVTSVGHGALLALLTELGLPASRSFAPADALPPGATVWWIEPQGVCRPRTPSADAVEAPWTGDAWLAAGGVAVVFLGADPDDDCAEIAGVTVPARTAVDHRPDAPRAAQTIDGPLVGAPRLLPMPALASFTDHGAGTVRAMIDGKPFVVAMPVGDGTLVLVADAAPLRNQWLDAGDAALFAMDLVRAYGVPRIDERSHGLHRERGAVRYLARSPAVPALLGIAVLGLLVVWHANLWPARRAPNAPEPAPTLEAFVDSLAHLYARSGDFQRVAERYQQLAAARLRRHFGLPADTPLPALLDRLRASRRAAPPALAALTAPIAARSAAALAATVRALDALVEDVTR
ncbi:hypothetical protein KF840_13635 [bacterium]|nr:hypothetical protein [bacterium]